MKNESFVCYLFVFFSCIEWPMVTFIAFNQPIFSLCIFFCRYTLRSNPNVCMQTLCKDCNHATKRVDQRVFTHSHTPDGTPQQHSIQSKCINVNSLICYWLMKHVFLSLRCIITILSVCAWDEIWWATTTTTGVHLMTMCVNILSVWYVVVDGN